MAQKTGPVRATSGSRAAVHFSLLGLIVFSLLLVGLGGLAAYGFASNRQKPAPAQTSIRSMISDIAPTNTPPWGELLVRDAQLEQPEEYIAFELQTNQPEQWIFEGMNQKQARELMLAAGVPEAEVTRALAKLLISFAGGVAIQPDDQLMLSLPAVARAKLYGKLAESDANHYMKFPFCYPGKSLDDCLDTNSMTAETVAMVKKLVYLRGDAQCFSDYQWLLQHVPGDAARLALVKSLSRQKVAFLRVHIRPGADIEKLVNYWGSVPGVRSKDLRPLLESVSRLEDGGNISVMFLLPQFARQRLYTFPMPGDPPMDCHWSTMNFFNDTPDNRFTDATYTTRYVLDHYYQVAKPTAYGDLIFVLDSNGNAIHSGVYICDDIIFTKNGNNFAQPWMLMHLNDLLARYANAEAPTKMVTYRNKEK